MIPLFDSASEARRSAVSTAGRRASLPLSETERDMIRLANEPGFKRWREQIHATGGCANPVYLAGRTTTRDAVTGEVLRHYGTEHEPGGRLAVRCRNRRESACGPCSRQHAGDTFHLVRCGLRGGKSVPVGVGRHPRLFVTLTAPSFGAVHRFGGGERSRCRPRRGGGVCEHGRPLGCGLVHAGDNAAVGTPLCPACYDYAGHVLWHAHAGELWSRTVRTVRRRLATAGGITQSRLGDHLRVSFAKVAEYQRRGAVHFHAVIRLDGPEGPGSSPPSWATAELLATVVGEAAAAVSVRLPYVAALGEHVFRWGAQLDVHEVAAFGDGSTVTDDAVAAYVAKYVSKSVGDAGGSDRRLRSAAEIELLPVSGHVRALMGTCWRLARLAELDDLNLRAWAHTLGFRGHALSKSRLYSTTYGELRAVRARYRGEQSELPLPVGAEIVSAREWRFVGSGHSPAEAEIAAGIAEDLAELAEIRRDLAADGRWLDD